MARNAELNEKMKDERRKQIVSTALKLFASKGLQGTKVSDIAEVSGISQGLMYHYFKSKEEIFIELIRNAFERITDAGVMLEEMELPPAEKIRLAIEKLLQTIIESEDFVKTCLLIAHANASEAMPVEAKEIIDREYRKPYDSVAQVMAEGQKDGSIKNHDAKEMALLFWTSINGLAIYKAVHPDDFKAPNPEILMSMFVG